ncbi:hypothetical protein B7486_67655 [cyanobacterium TDX16]|nr:hypothetical protein B7486_67655 [cyanobacterium TDX16]
MPVDVWVDDQGLIRRYESVNEISFTAGDQEAELRTSMVTEYFDFGTDVTIEVPEDATPIEDLVGEAGTGAGAEALEQAAEDAEAELEELEQEAAEALEALPEDLQPIAEAMAELSPEQLAEDPCQVVEDPELLSQCEAFLAPAFQGGAGRG